LIRVFTKARPSIFGRVLRNKKSVEVMSIGFDVGIQVSFYPKRSDELMLFLRSVVLLTMVRTVCKDVMRVKTTSRP
jgi:hypothetical protein